MPERLFRLGIRATRQRLPLPRLRIIHRAPQPDRRLGTPTALLHPLGRIRRRRAQTPLVSALRRREVLPLLEILFVVVEVRQAVRVAFLRGFFAELNVVVVPAVEFARLQAGEELCRRDEVAYSGD